MRGSPLPTGKLPPSLLQELIGDGPPLPPEVRLGPAVGEDACALDLGPGTLVATSDPITLTGSQVGGHAVVINANDVAVTGVRPRWFLATVLLPAGTTESDVRSLFAGMRDALAGVGSALLGGHTEVTTAVVQPVVVGVMLGHAETGKILRTGDMGENEALVQVGPAPIEGGAILAAGDGLDPVIEPAVVRRARNAMNDPGISVVEPALLAAELGATALHDPTEGGLSTGIYEMAEASGLRIDLHPGAVLWFEPGVAVCRARGADPWGTLASGTLLAAFDREIAAGAVTAFRDRGWEAAVIGHADRGDGVWVSPGSGLTRFARDEVARIGSEPGE